MRRHPARSCRSEERISPASSGVEPAVALLRRAVADQHFHIAGVGRGTVEDFRGDRRAPHDLGERGIFQVGEPRAVLRFGQEEIPEPGIAGLRFQSPP